MGLGLAASKSAASYHINTPPIGGGVFLMSALGRKQTLHQIHKFKLNATFSS